MFDWVGRNINFKHRSYPVGDHRTSFNELCGISWLWSVELSTMSAVRAVRRPGDLVELGAGVSLSCPLPGVLAAVSKERVSTSDIETSLVDS